MKKWFNVAVFGFLSMFLTGAGMGPTPTGLKDGKLQPCPDAPHCVSTQSLHPDQFIEPLAYPAGAGKEALMEKLLAHVKSMKRTKVVSAADNYLHFQVSSRLMRFKDDVEVYFDDQARLIHFRSSSRLGYYDFKVNRRRVEALQKFLAGTLFSK